MSSILLPIGSAGVTTGVTVSGSVQVSGIVGISGGGLTVSGGMTISGGVTVSGMVGISGNVAVVSGAISVISGSITVNSGTIFLPNTTQSGHNYVLEVGNGGIVVTASGAGIGSFASGGMTLASSGPLVSVTLRNLSGNGPMMIGGAVGTSGTASVATGVEMFANESLTMKVNNTNLLSVWNESAATSGQKVWILGLLQT